MISPCALVVLAGVVLPRVQASTPGGQGTVVDSRRALFDLVLISDGLDEPLLVAVRGGSSQELARGLEALRPDATLLFESLPEVGALDERVALAMAERGVDCALSAERQGPEHWSLRLWGDCADPPGVLVDPESTTGLTVGWAFASDPRPPEELEHELSLSLVEGPGRQRHAAWHLREGSGYELDTFRFALQVGDLTAVRQLERERRSGAAATTALILVGTGAGITGLYVMGRGFVQANEALRYEDQVRYEQKAWTGVVVMVGSGMVVSGIPRLRRSLVQRWERPDRYYERAQAQALLEAYNRDLARGLGESDAADPQGSEQREQP